LPSASRWTCNGIDERLTRTGQATSASQHVEAGAGARLCDGCQKVAIPATAQGRRLALHRSEQGLEIGRKLVGVAIVDDLNRHASPWSTPSAHRSHRRRRPLYLSFAELLVALQMTSCMVDLEAIRTLLTATRLKDRIASSSSAGTLTLSTSRSRRPSP